MAVTWPARHRAACVYAEAEGIRVSTCKSLTGSIWLHKAPLRARPRVTLGHGAPGVGLEDKM